MIAGTIGRFSEGFRLGPRAEEHVYYVRCANVRREGGNRERYRRPARDMRGDDDGCPERGHMVNWGMRQ